MVMVLKWDKKIDQTLSTDTQWQVKPANTVAGRHIFGRIPPTNILHTNIHRARRQLSVMLREKPLIKPQIKAFSVVHGCKYWLTFKNILQNIDPGETLH